MRLGPPLFRRAAIVAVLLVIAVVSARAFRTPHGLPGGFTAIPLAFVRAGVAIGAWAHVVGGVIRSPGTLRALDAENRRLRIENADLSRTLAEDRERAAVRLPDALPRTAAPSITARMVAATFRGPVQTVVLAAGSSDGIRTGDPVLARGALVGVAAETGAHRTVVRLLTDHRIRIAVEFAHRAGTVGITESDPGGGVVLGAIPRDAAVAMGAAIVTAAVNPGIPTGIPVGTISDLRVDPDGFFRRATIRPAANPQTEWFLTVLPQPAADAYAQ